MHGYILDVIIIYHTLPKKKKGLSNIKDEYTIHSHDDGISANDF